MDSGHEVEAVCAAERKGNGARLCIRTHCSPLPTVFRARLNLGKLESQHVRWLTGDRQKKSKSIPERLTHSRPSVSPWSRCTPAKRACYSALLILLILQLLPAHYWVTAKDFWCHEAWPMIKDGIDQIMKDNEPEFLEDGLSYSKLQLSLHLGAKIAISLVNDDTRGYSHY